MAFYREDGQRLYLAGGFAVSSDCCCEPATCCEQISGVEWVIDDPKIPPFEGCCPDLLGTYVPDPLISSACLYRILLEYPPPLTPCEDACVAISPLHYYLKTFDLKTEIFNVSPFALTTLTLVYRRYSLSGDVCTATTDLTQTWEEETTGSCPVGGFDVMRFKPTACNDISINPGIRLTINFS